MLNFTDHGAPRQPVRWPDGSRICFTVDIAFEGFVHACQYQGRPTPSDKPNFYSLSFAEYGLRVGVWRLHDILTQFNIKAGV